MNIDLIDAEVYADDDRYIMATVEKTDDNGEVIRLAHFIPRDAIEWRAAEYGIDPSDTETLLDVIIHEPHIKPDAAMQPYIAPSVDAAREHLLGHVQEQKAAMARGRGQMKLDIDGKGKGEDPRSKLLSLCHLDPEAVSMKSEMVHIQRGRAAAARRRLAPVAEDRLSKIRSHLKGMKDAIDADHSTRPGHD